MKNHLKYVIASLALLAGLGLGGAVRAAENAQPVVAQPATAQPSTSAQPVVIGPLAWQRVGAPTSLEG